MHRQTEYGLIFFAVVLIIAITVGFTIGYSESDETNTGGEVIFIEIPQIEIYSELPELCPLEISYRRQITSEYGKRWSPIYHAWIDHGGIDIAGLWHQEVLAAGSGIVTDVWISHPVWGKSVTMRHENGYKTFYAHLSCTYVYEGQKIKAGEIIGRVGNTGLSDGEHLHYEIWRLGQRSDPLDTMKVNPDEKGFF
jgi:murein DD-endopeptidase MepM/ murein hydrolase activator NlpD